MYNKRNIMKTAHKLYRDGRFGDFADCLRTAWVNEKKVVAVRTAIGMEAHTWYGWTQLGYEVIHDEQTVAQVVIVDTTKKGTRTISFFTKEQVCELGTQPIAVA